MTQDTAFAPADQEISRPFGIAYGEGGGGGVDRHARSHPSVRPYQHPVTRRASRTRDNIGQLHPIGLPIDPPLVASSSRTMPEDPGSATSPGVDSDPYFSFPNTPANASWSPSEGLGRDPQVNIRGMRFLSGPLVWVRLIFVLL